MTIDYERVWNEAQRLSLERGHDGDLTDLDMITEDAIDLAKSQASTEDVLQLLDTMIQQV